MLFGDECNYYKGLNEVCKTLDLQEVHIIRDSFTADVCPRITWAIWSDGPSFFNTVLVDAQFRRGEQFRWPTSLIHKISDDVRFAKMIDRTIYPTASTDPHLVSVVVGLGWHPAEQCSVV
jgi:hypothetical protein